MDRTEIYNKIVNIISEQLNIPKGNINENSNLESLGADSLDRFEIVMKLEEAFSIAINDDDAEKIITIADAVDYVGKLIKS